MSAVITHAAVLAIGIVIGLRLGARWRQDLRDKLAASDARLDAYNAQALATDHDVAGVATPKPTFYDVDPDGLDDGLVWCVKHRDGWCAVADGTEPAEGSPTVVTLCGYVVHYPWGYDRRLPDCGECETFVRDNDAEDEDDQLQQWADAVRSEDEPYDGPRALPRGQVSD